MKYLSIKIHILVGFLVKFFLLKFVQNSFASPFYEKIEDKWPLFSTQQLVDIYYLSSPHVGPDTCQPAALSGGWGWVVLGVTSKVIKLLHHIQPNFCDTEMMLVTVDLSSYPRLKVLISVLIWTELNNRFSSHFLPPADSHQILDIIATRLSTLHTTQYIYFGKSQCNFEMNQ